MKHNLNIKNSLIAALIVCFIFLSCKHISEKAEPQNSIQVYTLNSALVVGKTKSGQDLTIGGFSALNFEKSENGKLYFWTITDRGPNGIEQKDGARPFLLPQFSPLVVKLSLDPKQNNFEVESFRNIKNKEGLALTGLPPVETSDKKMESAIDILGFKLEPDNSGVDSEGLCRMQDSFFVSEEYGPDLLQFDGDLKLVHRWFPEYGLPADFNKRKLNRGLEGLACSDHYAYLMLQSPLKTKAKSDKDKIRLTKFDPKKSQVVNTYYYPIDSNVADKIGDLALIKDEQFLVIEQNGKLGSKEGFRKIYKIDLSKKDKKNILTKELIIDLNEVGFDYVEKIEGIAVVDANTIALITDNDFGIDGNIDLKSGRVAFKEDTKTYLGLVHLLKPLY